MDQQAVVFHSVERSEFACTRSIMTPSCYAPEEVFGAVVGNKTISADGTVDPRLDKIQLSDELTPNISEGTLY